MRRCFMDGQEYQLVVRLRVPGTDDVAARLAGRALVDRVCTAFTSSEVESVKLHELFEHRPPRKLDL